MVLTVLALCFITLDVGGGSLRSAHSGVRGTLGALYRGTDSVLGPVRRWFEGAPTAGSNQGRIESLEQDNKRLRGRISSLQADRRTTAQVQALQRGADRHGWTLLPARVTALGPGDGFDWTVTLNVGSRSGIAVGQSVTDGVALVGRVLAVDSSSSMVLLAADPGSGVGVRDVRSGEVGIATGTGPDGFAFTPLRSTGSVQVGDELLTGPVGTTSFAPGLAVGTVTSIGTSASASMTATVRPATSPTAVDVVAVIVDAGANVAEPGRLTPERNR